MRLWPVALLGLVALHAAAADRNAALTLIEQGSVAMRSDPEFSRRDAEQALEVLRKRPDADLEIRARLLLCDYYSERDSAAARQQIDAASALLATAQRRGLRAGILICQGETAETVGDNAGARDAFDTAVSVATVAADQQMLAEALYSRGYLRGLQGDYAAALGDLRRSQQLFDRIGMPQHALTVLNAVAITYNRMGDDDQAARIYERTQRQQHAAGLRRDETATLHNLGLARQKLGEWNASREAFEACLALSQQLHYVRGQAYALLGLASVDNSTGDPNSSLVTLDRSIELARQTPDALLDGQIQLVRGTALRQLERAREALPALQRAEAVFRRAGSLEELGTTYGELAAVDAQLGDWRAAYEYRSQAMAAEEKLLHNQLDQRFSTLKVEFDTATKEKENALLLDENAANQQVLAAAQRVGTLQTVVILLGLLALILLTTLVLHQRRGARRMHILAMTDELTGLPNRRALLRRLETLLQGSDTRPCSLLIIDIDYFKSVNDRYGHPVGDEVLRQFTAKLREAAPEPAFIGRLGGEEFAVVLPRTGLLEARRVAEQVRAQVPSTELAHWLGERRITVSVGVTTSVDTDTLSTLLRRADGALYAAKHAGRNCVRTDPIIESDLPTGIDAPALPPAADSWSGARSA